MGGFPIPSRPIPVPDNPKAEDYLDLIRDWIMIDGLVIGYDETSVTDELVQTVFTLAQQLHKLRHPAGKLFFENLDKHRPLPRTLPRVFST